MGGAEKARVFGTTAVLLIATGAFLGGCVGGCTFGVLTSSDSSSTSRSDDGSPTSSRSPASSDDSFYAAIKSVPVTSLTDGKLLASSTCLAFKQNPGTGMTKAIAQLAQQQGWTTAEARIFLTAATGNYCPQYRRGS